MRQLKLFSMSFLCLAAACACGTILSREVLAVVQPQRNDAGFHERLASAAPVHALSGYSKRLALSDCTFALTRPAATGTAAVARSCETTSRAIADIMPTHSQAWYVNALALAELGRTEDFLASYKRSRLTGPNEQWIAENRARLAEGRFDRLDTESITHHEADLTLLANSRKGTRTLARRYVSDEGFRLRIVDIVSRLSAERQRAFLTDVRHVLR